MFLFNLILSTITHSMALKCFTKAVFYKGQDETRLLDGAEWSDCADGETRCITATGGVFNTDVAACKFFILCFEVFKKGCEYTNLANLESGVGSVL